MCVGAHLYITIYFNKIKWAYISSKKSSSFGLSRDRKWTTYNTSISDKEK
jgi:hypothetical protein